MTTKMVARRSGPGGPALRGPAKPPHPAPQARGTDARPSAPASLGRRAALWGALGAAAAAAAVPALVACGRHRTLPAGASPAHPQPAAGAIVLNFAPNWQGAAWNKTAASLNQEFIDSAFNAKHRGLYVKVAAHVQGQADAQIAASLAGMGYMDVFQDCCNDLVVWQSAGLLAPLDTYIRRDNLNTDIWPKRHLEVLTFAGHILALPAYDGPVTIFYRQDILDQLGLRYPGPHWSYEEAATLWTACAGSSGGQPRAGVSLFFQAPFAQINWWMHAWGVAEMAPGRTASLMASPQGVACLTWIQDLVRNKVAIPRGGMNLLAQGQCVFKQSGGWELLPAAQQLSNRVKWDILPSPTWPAGRSTFNNIDFYGLNAASRHPDQAWELLRWVCAEPDYQRFQMRVTLVQPCLLNLWREWAATVQAVAPPLRGKQLHWLHNAEAEGYAWPNVFFKYAASEADTLVDQWLTEIWNGQVSPELGLRQLSAQLAALERGGAAETAAAAGAAKAFPSQGAPIAQVTPGV